MYNDTQVALRVPNMRNVPQQVFLTIAIESKNKFDRLARYHLKSRLQRNSELREYLAYKIQLAHRKHEAFAVSGPGP